MGQFDGRVALVTGAGSGLGRATAQQLASEGAAVACFDIATDAAEKTVGEIAEAGGTARAYTVDVSDPDSVRPAVEAAAKDLGRPPLVVNSAGIGRFAHTHEMPFDDWQRIIGVNLTGTFLVCAGRAPAPPRRRRLRSSTSRRTRASWASRTPPRTARRRPAS